MVTNLKTRNGKALKIFNRDTKVFDPAGTLREFSRYYQEVLDRRFDLRGFLDEQGVKKVSDLTESSFNTAIEDCLEKLLEMFIQLQLCWHFNSKFKKNTFR